MVVTAIVSVQVGASLAKGLFEQAGPTSIVWLRLVTSALLFVLVARPVLTGRGGAPWQAVLGLGMCLTVMNWAIYQSFARIPLGMAVTIEFLGPLALAAVLSRRVRDLAVVCLALVGIVLISEALTAPRGDVDLLGMALAGLAGACWAAYIVASRVAGGRLPGIQATALAMSLSTLVYLPVLLVLGSRAFGGQIGWHPFGFAVAAGALSSAIPYALDIIALRRLTAPVFGVLMSIHPVFAALSGLVVLGQVLDPHEWAGIIVVVVANAVGVWSRRNPPKGGPPGRAARSSPRGGK